MKQNKLNGITSILIIMLVLFSGQTLAASNINTTGFIDAATVCIAGDCETSWPSGTGNVSGGGITGAVAYWTDATTLGNSLISQSGSDISVNGTLGIGNSNPLVPLDIDGVSGDDFRVYDIVESNNFTIDNEGDVTHLIFSTAVASTGFEFAESYITTLTPDFTVSGESPVIDLYDSMEESTLTITNNGGVAGLSYTYGTTSYMNFDNGISFGGPNHYFSNSSGSQVLHVNDAGNLIIGQGSPTQRLDVRGSANISSDLTVLNHLYFSNTQGVYLQEATSNLQLVGGNFDMNNLNIVNINRAVISDTGSAEGYCWDASCAQGISIYTDAQGGYDGFVFDTTSGYPFVFNTESVGIGISTPDAILHVNTSNASRVPKFQRESTSASARLFAARLHGKTSADMVDDFGPAFVFSIEDSAATINDIAQIAAQRAGADNSGALTFYTYNAGSASEKMRIMPDGSVGIGTTAPTQELHVNGSVNITDGNISVSQNNGMCFNSDCSARIYYNGTALVIEG